MQSIVIIGAGGHAKAVIHTIEREGKYHIAGLLDANKEPGSLVYGYAILGDDTWLEQNAIRAGIIAIGDNAVRAAVSADLKSDYPDFQFITAIDPAAIIARGAEIGAGTVVMAGAIIGSDAVVGEHCIFYGHTCVEHDSVLESFVSLAPKATAGGQVRIGACTAIGIGATIIHMATIGEHTVIGAGATVVRSIPALCVAYGTPASAKRSRSAGDKYL
ncbi:MULTISPECIES: acetyltransferase [unclassified Paenibacillus]|uniref:acetyltransferase n=1 Tax=unclassified Paenibacillus TaxID=185978 RepID=UPI002F3E858E